MRDDLLAARTAEQRQDHRRWMNPRHLLSPGGIDVFAITNVLLAHDANLLEGHIRHLVSAPRPADCQTGL